MKILHKAVWFAATARNAIIVIFCLLLAATVDPDCPSHPKEESRELCMFTLTGQIPPGLPAFQPPPFSIANTSSVEEFDHQSLLSTISATLEENEDILEDPQVISFGGMLAQLGSAIIIIPLIAILESVAIAKAFAGGKPVDASQEMVALGICNIFGSFVQAMPTTGSFSRTAVNSASGVKTPMGGVYTGALVILCLAFLMPYCAFIPKASLAAVIITAVVSSVEYEVVKPIWRSKRTDLIPGLACFLGCLFYELEMGIGLGVVIQVLMVLYHTARPGLNVEVCRREQGSSYVSITPRQAVVFPSVSHIRSCINKEGQRQDTLLPVVVDCCHVDQVDYTAAKGFASMLKDFEQRGQQVYWLNCSASVSATIKAIAGELFLPISGLHQMSEDESDEGKTLLEKQVAKV
jgi:sodium-independent sulfate anion transporter 11